MQYAMTNGFFAETKDGHVIHSAQSAAIARDEKLKAVIGHHVEDVYPAAGYPVSPSRRLSIANKRAGSSSDRPALGPAHR